jgi:hypothetical protein
MKITKAVIAIAIGVGAVAGAVPAGATAPPTNPYAGLRCNCRAAAPDQTAPINRGLHDGIAATGTPAPLGQR